jgi:hypothetical protein
MLFALGHYRAAASAFSQYFSIDDASIADVLHAAKPRADGTHSATAVAAASIAEAKPIGPRASPPDAKATEILEADRRHAPGRLQRQLARLVAGFNSAVR